MQIKNVNRTFFYMAIVPIVILMILMISIVSGWCDTPSRLTDGVVEFATATVHGIPVFSQEDKQYWVDYFMNKGDEVVPIVGIQAEDFEFSLSTTIPSVANRVGIRSFSSFSDWKSCYGKTGLDRFYFLNYSNIPELDWIKSYYNSLP